MDLFGENKVIYYTAVKAPKNNYSLDVIVPGDTFRIKNTQKTRVFD